MESRRVHTPEMRGFDSRPRYHSDTLFADGVGLVRPAPVYAASAGWSARPKAATLRPAVEPGEMMPKSQYPKGRKSGKGGKRK